MSNERLPKKEYFQLRLKQAEEAGLTSKADYYRGRLEKMAAYAANAEKKAETPPHEASEEDAAKARAIANCQKAFEGLDEAGRLWEANRFIKACSGSGLPVSTSMAFLKEAGVMSDTELMHSITF